MNPCSVCTVPCRRPDGMCFRCGRSCNPRPSRARGRPPRLYTLDGRTGSLAQWAGWLGVQNKSFYKAAARGARAA